MTCCVWPGLCYKLCTFSSWKVRGSRLEQILDFSVPFRPWSLWYTISLTKSLQSISHSLVFHHVNKSPAQAEVGEDEEDRLQDVIDVLQLLLRKKKSSASEPGEQNATTTSQEWPMLSLILPSLPQHCNPTKIQGLEMFSQEPGLLWTVSVVVLLKMLLTQANCNKSFPNTYSLQGSVCKQWYAKRLLAEDTGKLNLHRLVMSVAIGSSFLSHIGSSNAFPLLSSSWLQSHGLNW